MISGLRYLSSQTLRQSLSDRHQDVFSHRLSAFRDPVFERFAAGWGILYFTCLFVFLPPTAYRRHTDFKRRSGFHPRVTFIQIPVYSYPKIFTICHSLILSFLFRFASWGLYWRAEDISWLSQKKEWAGLKSIAMTRNTTLRDGTKTMETRYFISSLPLGVNEIVHAIRGHWMVESHHRHLDVTFREDDNRTLNKQAAFNQSILRKLALIVLKIFDTGRKNTSIRMKRFTISTNPEKRLAEILSL